MKHLANVLTVLRVILSAVLAVLLLAAPASLPLETTRGICAVVFLVAAVSDFADGQIARRTKTVSDFGKFLDPVADKLLILSTLICLAVSPLADEGLHTALAATAVVVLFRELCVTSLRLLAAGKGLVLAAAGAGKVKTFVQCICVLWILLEPMLPGRESALLSSHAVSYVLLGLCILCTLYSGAVFVPEYRKAMQNVTDKENGV